MKKARLSQSERRESTQQKILDSACRLFGSKGYNTTALEDIASDAGITEGPIYHYFGNKKQLFTAVTERMEAHLVERISPLANRLEQKVILDIWDAFIETSQMPGFTQIVLIDSPHILGRERWYETNVVKEVERAIRSSPMVKGSRFTDQDLTLLIRMITSALAEAALMLATQPEYDTRALIQKVVGLLPVQR